MRKAVVALIFGSLFLLAGWYSSIVYFVGQREGELSFNVIAFVVLVAVWVLLWKLKVNALEFLFTLGLAVAVIGGEYLALKSALFFNLTLWLSTFIILCGAALGCLVWYLTLYVVCTIRVKKNIRRGIGQRTA